MRIHQGAENGNVGRMAKVEDVVPVEYRACFLVHESTCAEERRRQSMFEASRGPSNGDVGDKKVGTRWCQTIESRGIGFQTYYMISRTSLGIRKNGECWALRGLSRSTRSLL